MHDNHRGSLGHVWVGLAWLAAAVAVVYGAWSALAPAVAGLEQPTLVQSTALVALLFVAGRLLAPRGRRTRAVWHTDAVRSVRQAGLY